jgi:hypothetical protein
MFIFNNGFAKSILFLFANYFATDLQIIFSTDGKINPFGLYDLNFKSLANNPTINKPD